MLICRSFLSGIDNENADNKLLQELKLLQKTKSKDSDAWMVNNGSNHFELLKVGLRFGFWYEHPQFWFKICISLKLSKRAFSFSPINAYLLHAVTRHGAR